AVLAAAPRPCVGSPRSSRSLSRAPHCRPRDRNHERPSLRSIPSTTAAARWSVLAYVCPHLEKGRPFAAPWSCLPVVRAPHRVSGAPGDVLASGRAAVWLPRRARTTHSNPLASGLPRLGTLPAVSSNSLLSRPALLARGTLTAVRASWVGVGRARKKASVG